MRQRDAWALLFLLTLPEPVAAQAPGERARVEAYWNGLRAESTVGSVDSLAAEWRAATKGPLQRLGAAYAGLRRFELGDTAAAVPAWIAFSKVVATEPRWPWARYGLGLAALVLYRIRADVPSDYDGSFGGTHFDGFVVQMQRILDREPAFEPAVNLVIQVAAQRLDREAAKSFDRLVRRVEPTPAVALPLELALARAERLNGRYEASSRHFEQYARWGGDKSLAQLELARTLAGEDRLPEAVDAWYLGIATASPLRRAVYRADLAWIAQKAELARFDSLPDDSLAAFAKRFWDARDVRELRAEGERLAEHLRRWEHVHREFRVVTPYRRTMFRRVFRPNFALCLADGPMSLDDMEPVDPSMAGPDGSVERVLDHRALVYMRHGEPLRVVGGVEPNPWVNVRLAPGTDHVYSAWLYMIEGEPRAFYFQPDPAFGLDEPRALVLNQLPNLDMAQRLMDIMPGYGKLAARYQVSIMTTEWGMPNYRFQVGPIGWWGSGMAAPLTCLPGVMDHLSDLRVSAEVAMRTDTYARRITQPVDFRVEAYGIGRPGDPASVLVAFAARARALAPDSLDATRATVRVELAALDSTTGRVATGDTTLSLGMPRDRRDGWVAGLLVLPVSRAATEVRVLLQQGGEERGAFLALPVAIGGNSALSMSDIVVGSATETPPWRARDRLVSVSPFNTVGPGETVELYYELYGLVVGSEYRTQVTLRARAGDRSAASLSFTDQAVDTRQGFTRRLVLDDLPPGSYGLEITVDGPDGTSPVVRRRELEVR